MKPKREFFSADKLSTDRKGDLNLKILEAMQNFDRKLGVRQELTMKSFEKLLSRRTAASALNYLASEGVTIEGARVLDLGAGMGKLSVEAALRGAQPVAVEPGDGFGEIICEWLAAEKGGATGAVVQAAGEQLPFRDASFDLVISLQVLEHVTDPYEVLQEAFRVLKPGSFFYLTCENYLSFWEPHYEVAWLPLMPKPLGSLYLRLRGLSPEFLNASITYVTRPGVKNMLRRCGFISMREQKIKSLIVSPSLIKARGKRLIATVMSRLISAELLTRIILALEETTTLFRPGIYELLQKPHDRN